MAGRISRREALKLFGAGAVACGAGICATSAASADARHWHEAMYYDKLGNKKIRCRVCPKECVVGDRERGFCGCKENHDGTYHTLVYGQCAALNIDPIEKKPLFHYLPGTSAYSIAAAGCNFDCKDCQNWEISQTRPEQLKDTLDLPPQQVAAQAKRYKVRSIAYTYSEPVVFYEYMFDSAKAGRQAGIKSIMISNGSIRPEPMERLLPHLDAIKIDLKSISPDFYRDYCVGDVTPVLDTIKLVKSKRKWLEIVYLVVPTLNDDPVEVRDMCQWLMDNVGPDVPLHFSRFHPAYQLKKLPPTPYDTLERCADIARDVGLNYVYLGNVPGDEHATTRCTGCDKTLIRRNGFAVVEMNLANGGCKSCSTKVPGVWS